MYAETTKGTTIGIHISKLLRMKSKSNMASPHWNK